MTTAEVVDFEVEQRAQEDAPAGFDPAALFLLSMISPNLFDPTTREHVKRCKGCHAEVPIWKTDQHHAMHNRQRARLEERAKQEARKRGVRNLQKAREARAEARVSHSREVRPATVKPERERKPAAKAWVPKDASASRAVQDALEARLRADRALSEVEVVPNEGSAYNAFKLRGKLIGYSFFTSKPDLRFEAAIEVDDLPKKLRATVEKCNRSKDMAARTRIALDGLDLAVSMLTAAARKQGALK